MRVEEVPPVLRERLQARRPEIEQAILTRINAISDPTEVADPAYADGLRAAVSAAIDYGFAALGAAADDAAPVPVLLLAQSRLAARNRVSLDVVLRRYSSGQSLIGDYLVQEAGRAGFGAAELEPLLRSLSVRFERLLAAVGEEYAREADSRTSSSRQRAAELVKRLLAGGLPNTAETAYEFDASHLGVVLAGPGAAEAVRELATAHNRRLLLVQPGEDVFWAWLGGRRRLDPAVLLESTLPGDLVLAVGEPGEGIAGWRLSHRQAAAAMPIALRGPDPVVRYADAALLASILQDDLLATSLRQLYLEPLRRGRGGGEVLLRTLRAYLVADGNVSSTAIDLGVDRKTVSTRLQSIERRLGRPLSACLSELHMALRLDEADIADA